MSSGNHSTFLSLSFLIYKYENKNVCMIISLIRDTVPVSYLTYLYILHWDLPLDGVTFMVYTLHNCASANRWSLQEG